jgi:MEMO1 family protein
MDSGATRSVLQFEPGISHQQASGATPIAGLLITAQRNKLQPRLLDCRNSGDTAGGRDRVVGDASVSFGGAHSAYADRHGSEAIQRVFGPKRIPVRIAPA